MRVIASGNYSFPRVGHRCPVPRGGSLLPFYVADGEITVRWTGRGPSWATPAERAAHRAILPAQVLPAPPWPVLEDTQFGEVVPGEGPRGPNFAQAAPHTPILSVAPGVRVVFECGNFVNCTLPSEAADADIGNIQNAQLVARSTTNPDGSTIDALAEDEVTATFTAALRDEIASGRWAGHRRLGLVKEAARQRRLVRATREADLAALVAENDAAVEEVEARAR